MPLCNNKKERGWKICGYYFIFCWRCTGLIFGGILGMILLNIGLDFKNNLFVIFIACVPFIVDVLNQIVFKNISTNPRRFITGILFGIAISNFHPL